MVRKKWTYTEESVLIDNYSDKTIKELIDLLPGRDADAINSKIKRLKKTGKLNVSKSKDTIQRAYLQRAK